MRTFALSWLALALVNGNALAGLFTVGPDYERPPQTAPEQYKAASLGSWKEGTPLDHVPKGPWWEIFDDDTLNQLEWRAANSNLDIQAAVARVDQARATARISRSALFPALDFNPAWRRERLSPNQEPPFGDATVNNFRIPLDLSYEIDLWGRVRRGFESARAEAAASVALFHNILLTLQADVALNYFALRALDAEIASVTSTVHLRHEQVDLVRSRFDGGIGNELDISRAETELATTEAEAAVHHLSIQAGAQDRALANARRAAALATERYRSGLVSYLEVVDANRAALQTQRDTAQLAEQRLNATVQLIKALGGGWTEAQLLAQQ